MQYEVVNKLFSETTFQVVMKQSGLPFLLLQENSKVNITCRMSLVVCDTCSENVCLNCIL